MKVQCDTKQGIPVEKERSDDKTIHYPLSTVHCSRPAFLFPGQGAQFPGMALDLFERSEGVRELFALASGITGFDMKRLIGESTAEELKRTDIAQPALTLANLATAVFLGERGVEPCAAAGHSLGEYAALAVAGVISFSDCFRVVKERGALMHGAKAPEGSGMSAVLGLPPETVEALIAEWTAGGLADIYAANFNSPRQTVISGSAAALEEAERRFKEAGAKRVLRLQVSGPFHSPLMKEAADRFAGVLAAVPWGDPKIPLFSNVTGKKVNTGAEAKELALKQIVRPVRWTEEEAAIAALAGEGGIDAVVEAGPGKVLQGLWRDGGSTVPCYGGEICL
jgi:[acyl-carrier-protein] S-malonyltransferase